MNTQATLKELDACLEARQWAGDRPWRELWQTCPRGDWLLWGLGKLQVDRKVLVRPAVACAELVERYIPSREQQSAQALEITRKWLRGKATIEEVREAAAKAAYAATAAAGAAEAAYWAGIAAKAAAEATAAAGAAAEAAAAAAEAAYAAAKVTTDRQCADLVREHVQWSDVEAALPKGVVWDEYASSAEGA